MIPRSQTGKTLGYCHVASSGPKKHSSQEGGSLSHKPHRVTSADILDRRVTQSTWVQETQPVPSRGSWEPHCENTGIDTPWCSRLGPLFVKGNIRGSTSWTHRDLSWDKRTLRLGTIQRKRVCQDTRCTPPRCEFHGQPMDPVHVWDLSGNWSSFAEDQFLWVCSSDPCGAFLPHTPWETPSVFLLEACSVCQQIPWQTREKAVSRTTLPTCAALVGYIGHSWLCHGKSWPLSIPTWEDVMRVWSSTQDVRLFMGCSPA